MPNKKYLPIGLENREECVRRLKECVTLLETKGGVAAHILEASGLKKLAESGKLDSATCTAEELGKLDLYVINTCLQVLQMEFIIRKEYYPFFSVDTIPYLYLDDVPVSFSVQGEPKVRELFEKPTDGIFLVEKGLDLEKYPHCYKYLAYVTAYIKYYYPGVANLMLNYNQEIDTEKVDTMGIYVESYVTYGAYVQEDNTVAMIPRISTEKDETPLVAREFDGFGDILNAGVAASKMGIVISDLKEAFENITGNEPKSVVISMPTLAPNGTRIRSAMQKCLHAEDKNSREYMDARVYEELELEGAGTRELVEKAADLADISRVEVVPKALCIYAAYEGFIKDALLKDNEWGLILDWNEQSVCVSLLQRKFGQIMINWQEIKCNPLLDLEKDVDLTEETMWPQYRRIEKLIRTMLQEIQIEMYEISKVYLAGEYCNYSYVYSWVDEFVGGCTECFTMSDTEYVAAKGAAYLAAKKIKK